MLMLLHFSNWYVIDQDSLMKIFPTVSLFQIPISEAGAECLPGGLMALANAPKSSRETNRRNFFWPGGTAPTGRGWRRGEGGLRYPC